MKMRLTTVGVIVAAALILIPYGTADKQEAPVEPAAARPAAAADAPVADQIAEQGNAALVQIRSEVTQPMPPDLTALKDAVQPE